MSAIATFAHTAKGEGDVPFDHDYLALIDARVATVRNALAEINQTIAEREASGHRYRRSRYVDTKHRLQSELWELDQARGVIEKLYEEDAQEPLWIAAGYGPRISEGGIETATPAGARTQRRFTTESPSP